MLLPSLAAIDDVALLLLFHATHLFLDQRRRNGDLSLSSNFLQQFIVVCALGLALLFSGQLLLDIALEFGHGLERTGAGSELIVKLGRRDTLDLGYSDVE